MDDDDDDARSLARLLERHSSALTVASIDESDS